MTAAQILIKIVMVDGLAWPELVVDDAVKGQYCAPHLLISVVLLDVIAEKTTRM